MKKHYFLLAGLFMALFVSSCQYDDQDLWDSLDKVENRLDELEKSMAKANSDIQAIQEIVKALQENVTVKEVVTTDNGYVIKFSDGKEATISNGKDGADAPVISIKKDTDGEYYWTSNDEWLLVDGKKVKASGTDGVTPQVRINPDNKEWEISTDNGATWTTTGVVAEGDSFFKSVDTSKEGYVVFTLVDGTEICLSKYNYYSFTIMGMDSPHHFLAGTEQVFNVSTFAFSSYTINKPNGWIVNYDEAAKKVSIKAPAKDAVGAETTGTIDFMLVTEDAKCHIFKYKVEVSEYVLRKLTFEDEDYKNAPYTLDYCQKTINTWSDLIDPTQNGPLLNNGNAEEGYKWFDTNCTELKHSVGKSLWTSTYTYMGGGHAVSNFVDMNLANGDPAHQLAVYYKDVTTGFGGHNGSKNFCVHYGYNDDVANDEMQGLPALIFQDNVERVIDHMWVTSTTYAMNIYNLGNAFSKPVGDGDYVKIIAKGYGKNGEFKGRVEFKLAEGKDMRVTNWTKWDLSVLGPVAKVEFNVDGTDRGQWGLNTPAYFAYDDVAVRFAE